MHTVIAFKPHNLYRLPCLQGEVLAFPLACAWRIVDLGVVVQKLVYPESVRVIVALLYIVVALRFVGVKSPNAVHYIALFDFFGQLPGRLQLSNNLAVFFGPKEGKKGPAANVKARHLRLAWVALTRLDELVIDVFERVDPCYC